MKQYIANTLYPSVIIAIDITPDFEQAKKEAEKWSKEFLADNPNGIDIYVGIWEGRVFDDENMFIHDKLIMIYNGEQWFIPDMLSH
jgi:hypothetical protein